MTKFFTSVLSTLLGASVIALVALVFNLNANVATMSARLDALGARMSNIEAALNLKPSFAKIHE